MASCPAARAGFDVMSRVKGDTGARVSLQRGSSAVALGAAEPAPGVRCFAGKLSSLQHYAVPAAAAVRGVS